MDRHALGLHWEIPPGLTFLNHGSFGLAPRELLQWRFALLQRIEHDPVHFLTELLPQRIAAARHGLAELVGAQPQQLAFVPSTTYGLNELVQRLELPAGSEVLISDHTYNATSNLLAYAAQHRGWRITTVPLPWPLQHPDQLVQAFAEQWSPQTRLLLIDHITSPSALVLPLQPLVQLARERGALVIVDGAHGPGSVPLDLQAWRPHAYVGNLHKWLCCPRGAAFLWVEPVWSERLRPLVVSHGANQPLTPGVSRFHAEHDWIGTADPTPWLALPEALRLLSAQGPLDQLMGRNSALAAAWEPLLLEALAAAGVEVAPLAPQACRAAMLAVPLPDTAQLDGAALQAALRVKGFQVPVIPLRPHSTTPVPQFLRLSAFAYNTGADGQALAAALEQLLPPLLR